METLKLTLSEAQKALQRGEFTAQELEDACRQKIDRLNPRINAFLTIIPPRTKEGPPTGRREDPPLYGLPLAVKDLYETAGVRTTGGTRFFADNVPIEDAQAVVRLKRAGAVILGKTNTHEIALGVTNINEAYGTCLNPWDLKRITGGSSGGSAAAVASGMALAALGTDTGGSIRIPASLCGVIGLKPTYGRVSLRGVMPLSWNLDHAGPLAKSVRDVAMLLQVLAGFDPEDPGSIHMPVDDSLSHLEEGVQGWKVTLAVGEYIENCDEEVLNAVRVAAQVLESAGAQVEEREIPWLREAAQANGLMTQADAAAVHRAHLKSHPDWFGDDVRERLQAGAACTSTEYVLARRTQATARREAERLFTQCDILLLPSTPIPAPSIEGTDAIEQVRRLTRFTAPFNITGLPALSIPCGLSGQGLPLGLQMVAGHWFEAKLLRAARAYEERHPLIYASLHE